MRALFIYLIVSYSLMALILLLYFVVGRYPGDSLKYNSWVKKCALIATIVGSPIFVPWWIVSLVRANRKGAAK